MDLVRRDFDSIIKAIQDEDSRYSRGAYYFLRQALDYTISNINKSETKKIEERHISGQELLEGIRHYALEQYGPMSYHLLNSWGIFTCNDFGNIVFNLVECQVLGKTEKDSPEDFRNGYNFEDAFLMPFMPNDKTKLKKPRLY